MRLPLLSVLLLSAATPVLADPLPAEPAERIEAERPERPARAEREDRRDAGAGRPLRVDRDFAPQSRPRLERPERSAAMPEPVRDIAAAGVAEQRRERAASADRGTARQDRAARASGWQGDRVERRNRQRAVPPSAGSPVFGAAIPTPDTIARPSRDVSAGSVTARDLRDRIAAEGVRRDRIERAEWRQEWRRDRRYDWRRHRDRDRNRFHLSVYIDPFGWRYRDYDIGWRLPARYYTARYWLQDPWAYRLPPVGGYYRWVRYYNDVLLVDVRNGRVLDRIQRFFW